MVSSSNDHTRPRRAVHLTSVHQRNDTRIFHKQCVSLARNGWDTTLVVADNHGSDRVANVAILDVGSARNRVERMRVVRRRMLRTALQLEADVYQLHDPELLPVGLRLTRSGKRVVFDFHEDVPREIMGKDYLPRRLRPVVSQAYEAYERWSSRRFAGLIAATPTIDRRLRRFHSDVEAIFNYPLLDEVISESELARAITERTKGREPVEICYVGGISRVRGVNEMVTAIGLVRADAVLRLAGEIVPGTDTEELRRSPGWQRTEVLGFLGRDGVKETMRRSSVGLVTLLPDPNFETALPVKLFEYMSAGIPVIASDFPVWKAIVEEAQCGMCVDPSKPSDIAKAIDYLIENQDVAREMGLNGRRTVKERFNWSFEEKKLLRLYEHVVLD